MRAERIEYTSANKMPPISALTVFLFTGTGIAAAGGLLELERLQAPPTRSLPNPVVQVTIPLPTRAFTPSSPELSPPTRPQASSTSRKTVAPRGGGQGLRSHRYRAAVTDASKPEALTRSAALLESRPLAASQYQIPSAISQGVWDKSVSSAAVVVIPERTRSQDEHSVGSLAQVGSSSERGSANLEAPVGSGEVSAAEPLTLENQALESADRRALNPPAEDLYASGEMNELIAAPSSSQPPPVVQQDAGSTEVQASALFGLAPSPKPQVQAAANALNEAKPVGDVRPAAVPTEPQPAAPQELASAVVAEKADTVRALSDVDGSDSGLLSPLPTSRIDDRNDALANSSSSEKSLGVVDAASLASSFGIAHPTQTVRGVEFYVATRINGTPGSALSLLIPFADMDHPELISDQISVRVDDVLNLLRHRVNDKLFAQIISSKHSQKYVTLNELRSAGISVSFDHHDRLVFKAS